jgi:FkbM family methyltransferase
MTASFAECVGSKGLVVSVEPAPATHAWLRQAMQLLGHHNIRFEPVCVADHKGPVAFMVATGEGGDVEAAMKIDAQRSDQFTEVMIPAVTIDSLVDKHGIADRLSLVKIDIEGAEPIALRGGSRLFDHDRLPLFIVEVQKGSLENFGLKPLDVLQFFPGELFELFHVQRSLSDLTPRFEHGRLYALTDTRAHDWPIYSNLVAVPRLGHYVDRRSSIEKFLDTSA